MRLPIYVLADSGIDLVEENAIMDGFYNSVKCFPAPRKISYYGARTLPSGVNADWYVNNAPRNINKQIDSSKLLELLLNDPWQRMEPHITVLFTSSDLCPPGFNFVFGQAWDKATVQSVYRYRGLNNTDRTLLIQAVIAHELGHIFGLAGDLKRPHTIERFGPHCTNRGCIMRQQLSLEQNLSNVHESAAMGMLYCPECMQDAQNATI